MMTTPQRLDQRLALMDRRMAEFRRRAEATKAFYAALSPQQQQVFDALGRLHGMHGGWGDKGHGGMHPPMGGRRAPGGWEGGPPPPPPPGG